MSLRRFAYGFGKSGKGCIGVVGTVRGMRCLDMYCSTTAGRNPRSWGEGWSLKAARCSRTAEGEVVGIATSRSAYIACLRR